jgi:hypothetical protein
MERCSLNEADELSLKENMSKVKDTIYFDTFSRAAAKD